MQVLGDLVGLTEERKLPLPWWHRAPLGLATGTQCFVAFVRSATRPAVPEIVVSVLNPSEFSNMVWLRLRHADDAGVVATMLDAVKDFNVALAESITLETGDVHELTLVCEWQHPEIHRPTDAELSGRLAASGIRDVKIRRFDSLDIVKQVSARVTDGWLSGISWRQIVTKNIAEMHEGEFDLSRAVISADTSRRLLRFVFPRHNATTLCVTHIDRPGVLKRITDSIAAADLNMLSMLLRRGGLLPPQAVMVAVCESKPGQDHRSQLDQVTTRLNALPKGLQIDTTQRVASDPETLIIPRESNVRRVRTPRRLLDQVQALRATVPKGGLGVFLSHRLQDDRQSQDYANAARRAIVAMGCTVLEVALRGARASAQVIHDEVMANLWAADAGIVFVSGRRRVNVLGSNLPHEYGFLQGQAKPAMILVERGVRMKWSNIDGVYVARFAPRHALTDTRADSIYRHVREYIASIGRR